MGGGTVDRLGDINRAILGGVGHRERVALGVAGRPGDTQSGCCCIHKLQAGKSHFSAYIKVVVDNEILTYTMYH